MDNELANDELQRRIKITSLLQHGGFDIFMAKVKDLKMCAEAELEAILKNPVTSEKVALLNTTLGKANALSAVLAIQDELKEEITPADGDTSEEVNEGI